MTPREFQWEADAAQKRMNDESDLRVALAWEIERMRILSGNAAAKKQPMPDLKSVLHRKQSKRQSPSEMRKALQMLSEQYGIPIKTVVH